MKSRSKSPQVMMLTDPMQFQMPPVQEKSFVRIETEKAETESLFHMLNDFSVQHKLRMQRIKRRVFGIPQFHIANQIFPVRTFHRVFFVFPARFLFPGIFSARFYRFRRFQRHLVSILIIDLLIVLDSSLHVHR